MSGQSDRNWYPCLFKSISDGRGSLTALEQGEDIPFEIKRIYYIFGVPRDVRRGLHAHKRLSQMMIVMSGSCTILVDDGETREEFRLDEPTSALFIGPCVWREMYDFSANCVLVVIANEHYIEEDYIRNYDAFLEYRVRDAKGTGVRID